tara:strand:- start:568 stop:1122 length:555 start_codon:yes stop_codon:yes gene_type:complete
MYDLPKMDAAKYADILMAPHASDQALLNWVSPQAQAEALRDVVKPEMYLVNVYLQDTSWYLFDTEAAHNQDAIDALGIDVARCDAAADLLKQWEGRGPFSTKVKRNDWTEVAVMYLPNDGARLSVVTYSLYDTKFDTQVVQINHSGCHHYGEYPIYFIRPTPDVTTAKSGLNNWDTAAHIKDPS